jgi:uncharacterized pyridoxal phosphate-dependent enzyme
MGQFNYSYGHMKIPRVINAAGTLTSLGGCRTHPEVIQAMAKIAGEFLSLEELHHKAGEHLARMLGVEAAMVTSGAAAGLSLATAACMVGEQAGLASQLPTPPPKSKVIIQCCHRNPFERAILLAGATLVQVGDSIRTRSSDLEAALEEETSPGKGIAAVAFFLQGEMLEASLSLSETLEIAHAHNVPVIVDAAAELPPKSNLWTLAAQGADLVIFSGSKDLRGPQTSGLMVGRGDLISAARQQTAPHEHVIGRPMKAGKEIVAGMLAAVELYLAEDETARFAEWGRIADFIESGLGAVQSLHVRQFYPDQPYIQPAIVPRLAITLEPDTGLTIAGLKQALWQGNPPIAVEVVRDELWINVHTLTLDEARIIVQHMRELFSIRLATGYF